jgi:hypothetical protein
MAEIVEPSNPSPARRSAEAAHAAVNARRCGFWCGTLHGSLASPFVAFFLWIAFNAGTDYTLLLARHHDAPPGQLRAEIDGWELTPRLVGAAGIEFHTERRHRSNATLVVTVDGHPDFRIERRLSAEHGDCRVVSRLMSDRLVASDCLWRMRYD